MARNIRSTGYWTFMCNPKIWRINEFLTDLLERRVSKFGSWTITNWQYDYFMPGQHGVVRVGIDRRSKQELRGEERLKSGVYAIVKVLSEPRPIIERVGRHEKYYGDSESSFLRSHYFVDIEYVANLIDNPLTMDFLRGFDEIVADDYLIPGFQASTIPLGEGAFTTLVQLANAGLAPVLHSNAQNVTTTAPNLLGDLRVVEREAVIKARIGQSEIRDQALSMYGRCKICGLNDKRYLIASHIKPWSESNNTEKLDINNVLLLCPNHDALFDKRYISFTDEGKVIISAELSARTKQLMGITDGIVITVSDGNKQYLEWHRNHMR